MTDQEFPIVPAGKAALIFPLLIGLLLPLGLAMAMLAGADDKREILPVLPTVLVLPLAAAFLAHSMHRRRIMLGDKGLLVRRFPWPRWIKLAELDLAAARILDLEEHPELRPVWKIAGTGLPGFRSGLFRLRDRRRATVLLTSWRRVLVLPRRDGTLVMLSPERPDALLQAMQRAAG
jgi:hypothetical protein